MMTPDPASGRAVGPEDARREDRERAEALRAIADDVARQIQSGLLSEGEARDLTERVRFQMSVTIPDQMETYDLIYGSRFDRLIRQFIRGSPEIDRETGMASRPAIRKLGTIDCDMVETTPLVFRDRLYRFEYVRDGYHANPTGDSYFRFIDTESGEPTPAFAPGWHLGSAHVRDDTAYVYGVDRWGESTIGVFWSTDLETWSTQTALRLPGWALYNTSVCEGPDGFAMAFEVGGPEEVVGVRFTNRFARSDDLLTWELLPSESVFSTDRYTACPALRYVDGRYYMIYLEACPGPTYEPHIVRTADLINWESSPYNPVMAYSDEDHQIANPGLSAELGDRITKAVNLNNSDVDLCEYLGKVVLTYSWGNQKGIEHLATAEYQGSLEGFLKGFFPT